ncbi:MAG: zinc-ribbon and DUF3426 domain-containing protein [Rhodanobacteraceae bacterium]
MYTQCPECLTIFEIDENAVQASLGIVHCGHCARRFDALRTLSDTLPAEPNAALAEQDPADLVPTLTEAVPPSAFEPAAKSLRPESDATQASLSTESSLPSVAGEAQPTQSDQPIPGSSSEDWFADLETEFTASLVVDADGASPDERIGDNTWQVSDLHARTRFPDMDIPINFAGPGAIDSKVTVVHDPRRLTGHDPIAQVDSGTSAVAGSFALADGELPAITQTEIPFDEFDSPYLDEPVQPPADEMAPLWPDELDMDPSLPDEVLPMSIPLPPGVASRDVVETPDAESIDPESARAEVVSDPARLSAPVYVRPRHRRAAGLVWTLGCLLLALMLAAQFAWIKRVELFRNATTHQWATQICLVIACGLPPIRDVAKLELLSRDVRPDPRITGALMVTTTVRNDATFRQPWPVVVVELTDLDNNPVAMRRFRPAEYMPDPGRRAAGIAPGATAAIAFEVADPGKRAVAFQFSFE